MIPTLKSEKILSSVTAAGVKRDMFWDFRFKIFKSINLGLPYGYDRFVIGFH